VAYSDGDDTRSDHAQLIDFNNFRNNQFLVVNQFTIQGNRDDLREMLTARQAGGIIFTTVQKFSLLNGEQTHPVLNTRSNIVVISDEAHRSQYGLNKEVEEVIEDEEDIASR
jgi:type I restriction enzyme R subunit